MPATARSLAAVNAEIVELRPEDTHALRRSILRDGTTSDVVEFEGDELAGTLHLGAMLDGELIAISTWLVRPHPDLADRVGVQLRGMATDPRRRGSGVSAALLASGIDRCRSSGADHIWARARVAALNFYLRHGFEPVGAEYIDATTGLAHCDIIRLLD